MKMKTVKTKTEHQAGLAEVNRALGEAVSDLITPPGMKSIPISVEHVRTVLERHGLTAPPWNFDPQEVFEDVFTRNRYAGSQADALRVTERALFRGDRIPHMSTPYYP